ncbi:MAG: type II secretion system secretin GspD [Deltaproteobacteria bacterium]|nr:type II secretion system secretin GspD [Deltaproteobacteria bacterium]
MTQKNAIKLGVFALGFFIAPAVFAQGFKKIDVQNKYGAPSATSSSSSAVTDPKAMVNEDGTLPEGMTWFRAVDTDLKEMVKEISALTGKNFILSDNNLGRKKITIVSDQPMTIEMAYQAFLSALEINGLTTVVTPSGLINIVPHKDSLTKPLELYKEDSPNTDKFITRIIQVTNISANEIAQILKDMVSKEAKLIAYPTTNSLIITDTGSNIVHLQRLIKELDQEGPQEDLEMIPVLYADAKDISEKITQIYEKEDTQSNIRTRRRSVRRGVEEMEDVQTISKVIADERTNSILVMGTKRGILKVRALISRLDRYIEGADGKIHVYYLRYAKAKDVSEVLSSLVSASSSAKSTSKSSSSSRNAKAADAGAVSLEGGVQVTADESTNSLIVVSSPKDYRTLVDQVIAKLDILRPQIFLESVIMSLDVQKTQTLGVSGMGGLLNTLVGGNQLTSFGGILPTTPDAISTIASASGGFGGGIISSDTIDLTLSDGSTASIPSVSGILMALRSDTDANVLSTPSVMVLDNEEAQIQVGQEVPVPSGTTVSSGVTTFDVTREDTGIILKITPQISENDSVRLNINQEITSVFTTDTNLGPTLDKKSVETTVMAKNKQTIVIGGLIDDQATVTTHKVPILGDVPVLGTLFRTRVTQKNKSNLIVFITPYIIRERKDYLAIVKKKIEERNKFIDANYGASQKKIIRRAIHDHATDLLEFKCSATGVSDPCPGLEEEPAKPVSTR